MWELDLKQHDKLLLEDSVPEAVDSGLVGIHFLLPLTGFENNNQSEEF